MSGAGLPGLTTRVLGRTVISLDEVDSTNRYLKERAGELPHGTACLTGCQRAGRGRLGRSWDVPDGQTLALSVLFRTGGDVERLPLLCGLAVSGALEALTGAAFRIKRLQLVEDGGGGLLQRKRPAGELQNRARVGQTGLGEPSGGLPQIDPHARHHGQPALPVRPTLT